MPLIEKSDPKEESKLDEKSQIGSQNPSQSQTSKPQEGG